MRVQLSAAVKNFARQYQVLLFGPQERSAAFRLGKVQYFMKTRRRCIA